jgi:hypothetical protein
VSAWASGMLKAKTHITKVSELSKKEREDVAMLIGKHAGALVAASAGLGEAAVRVVDSDKVAAEFKTMHPELKPLAWQVISNVFNNGKRATLRAAKFA